MQGRDKTTAELLTDLQVLRRRLAPWVRRQEDRQEVMEVLLKAEERLRVIFDSNPDFVFLTDFQGNFLDANTALLERMGTSLEALRQKSIWDFLTEENRWSVYEAVNKIRNGEEVKSFSVRAQSFQGDYFFLELNTIPLLDNGQVIASFNIARDITERVAAEAALKESEEKYFALMDHASDAILLSDIKASFLDANQRAEELLGYAKEEILTKNFYEIFPPEERLNITAEIERTLRIKRGSLTNMNLIRSNGTLAPVDITMSMVQYADQQVIQASLRDVTARKKAEEEIYKLVQFRNSVIDNANVWMTVFNQRTAIVIWNKAAEEISGYSLEDVNNHANIWEALYPDENYRVEVLGKMLSMLQLRGIIKDYETTIIAKNKKKRII